MYLVVLRFFPEEDYRELIAVITWPKTATTAACTLGAARATAIAMRASMMAYSTMVTPCSRLASGLSAETHNHEAHYPQADMTIYLILFHHLELLYLEIALAYLEKLLYPPP